jgi:hypothetical protein
VILVLRFGQPTLLTVALAGFAAVGFGAEFLVTLIAAIALKKLLAAKTFHQIGRTSNTHASHTRSTVLWPAGPEEPARRRKKKCRGRG